MTFKWYKIIRLALVLAAAFFVIQAVSCESYSRSVLTGEKHGGYETMVLHKNGKIRCNMLMSKELYSSLCNQNDKLYSSLIGYIEILSSDSIDTNVICIDADISDILEGFSAYDANVYAQAKNALEMDIIKNLMPRDYYVAYDNSYVLIFCGSTMTALNFLEILNDDFFAKGFKNGGNYITTLPKTGIYNGQYLKGIGIAGNNISNYYIEISKDVNVNGGSETAKYIYDYFTANSGIKLDIKKDYVYNDPGCEIIVGKNSSEISKGYYKNAPEIMDYSIVQSNSALYIMGGSDWAMEYAFDIIARNYFENELSIPEGYKLDGNIRGEYIDQRTEETELRLMSNNIWEWDKKETDEWLRAGLKCLLRDRVKSFAEVYMRYNPDVICFQEVPGAEYIQSMTDEMKKYGRSYELINCDIDNNYTPMIYDISKLALVNSGFHRYSYGSNHGSKSYTWAVFRDKKTFKSFVVVCTHLWWKQETFNENNSKYRTKQFEELGKLTDELSERYDCPCFVLGDMNCSVTTQEFKSSAEYGLVDCHDIALSADNTIGRFICDQKFYSYAERVGTYKNAIDHIFVKNLDKGKILTYNIESPGFMGTLSDHSPVFVDVNLG